MNDSGENVANAADVTSKHALKLLGGRCGRPHNPKSRLAPERSELIPGSLRVHRAGGQLPAGSPGHEVTMRPAAAGSEVAVIKLASTRGHIACRCK